MMKTLSTVQEFTDNCVFCAGNGHFISQTDNFYLRLDDSPIIEGHSLICTNKHYPSFADIDFDLIDELESFMAQTRHLFERVYGACMFFEHGRTASCAVRNPNELFCYHAHIHAVPIATDISQLIAAKLPQIQIKSWRDLIEQGQITPDGYLFIETPTETRSFYPVVRPIGQHFLRTCLANTIGHPNRANWVDIFGSTWCTDLIEEAKNKLNRTKYTGN
jgi:diadenosine tetraphosphate (Ap4A) HIT family hydrolase